MEPNRARGEGTQGAVGLSEENLIRAREILNATSGREFGSISIEEFPLPEPIRARERESLEVTLKKRHLNKDERQRNHRPASDWEETHRGETCKSACSLEIKDLLVKSV